MKQHIYIQFLVKKFLKISFISKGGVGLILFLMLDILIWFWNFVLPEAHFLIKNCFIFYLFPLPLFLSVLTFSCLTKLLSPPSTLGPPSTMDAQWYFGIPDLTWIL